MCLLLQLLELVGELIDALMLLSEFSVDPDDLHRRLRPLLQTRRDAALAKVVEAIRLPIRPMRYAATIPATPPTRHNGYAIVRGRSVNPRLY